jgi:hypothetical protein
MACALEKRMLCAVFGDIIRMEIWGLRKNFLGRTEIPPVGYNSAAYG